MRERASDSKSAGKVRELLLLLEATHEFLRRTRSPNVFNMRKLITALRPFGRMNMEELQFALKKASEELIEKEKKGVVLSVADIRFEQLEDPNLRKSLSRAELALVAERELGISKSKLLRLGRKEIENHIENALESSRSLDTIAKAASNED